METSTELEKWLSKSEFLSRNDTAEDSWNPGFEIDRQVIVAQIGKFYHKVFLRPDDFVQRFYHQVYQLPIEDWHYHEQIDLYEGFCLIDIDIELRFQATLNYAQRNVEHLDRINQHIKQQFKHLLTDIVHQQIQQLGHGNWVEQGLLPVERQIAREVNEQLMVQNILPRAICKLKVRFDEFPNIHPGRDNVYLHVLKKNYQNIEQKNQTYFRQRALLKEQKLQHKQQQLEMLYQFADVERQKRAIEAENKLILLKDKEMQLAEELVIKKRLAAEKNRYKNELTEMELHGEMEIRQKQKARKRALEKQDLEENLKHQMELEALKQQAEIEKRTKQQEFQSLLHEKKTQAEIERYEKQQETWREAKLRIRKQQLAVEKKQKQLEEEAVEYFKKQQIEEQQKYPVMPFQKIEKFIGEDRSQDKAEMMRNEIELAVLEKQRLELELAIQEAKKNQLAE